MVEGRQIIDLASRDDRNLGVLVTLVQTDDSSESPEPAFWPSMGNAPEP